MALKLSRPRFTLRSLTASAYYKLLDFLPQGAPPEPHEQVRNVIADIGMSQADISLIFRLFQKLRYPDGNRWNGNQMVLSSGAVLNLIATNREFVGTLLRNILQLGGCYELVDWNQFLYVLLRFCSLNKVELCQLLFLIIVREMKGLEIHYLTTAQLDRFYERYRGDRVPANMDCNKIHFSNFPLARYYVTDFVEISFLYCPLVNPILYLQRQLQRALPSARFWDTYDFISGSNRQVTLDFFLVKRRNVNMTASANFQETCDLLILRSDFAEAQKNPAAKSAVSERWIELDFLSRNRAFNTKADFKIDEVYKRAPVDSLLKKKGSSLSN